MKRITITDNNTEKIELCCGETQFAFVKYPKESVTDDLSQLLRYSVVFLSFGEAEKAVKIILEELNGKRK